MITDDPSSAVAAHAEGNEFVIFNGDCARLLAALPPASIDLVLTSPPYFMGKNYDRSYSLDDFTADHRALAPDLVGAVKDEGNLCWQVGYHVHNGALLPLDFAVHEVFRDYPLSLRNRIVWHFGHGTHARQRFSGRHETLLWYGKSPKSYFDLDATRIPQKYPGKRHYKGPKKGELSGNPAGKNPSDVWEIPNVNANHVEKTDHPCQFPIALAQRCVRAFAPPSGAVFDPFAGSGSAGLAAVIEGRAFLGADLSREFCEIAERRYLALKAGTLPFRPIEKPIMEPSLSGAVARRPDHFTSFQ